MSHTPPFILITSCSSTRTQLPQARVGHLASGLTMRQALDDWMDMLDKYEANITPREQYRGQGFTTLTKIIDEFNPAGVKIVTGGLGLTDIDEKIVPYDFTASKKEPENIHQKVTAEPFVQPTWWRMINDARHDNPVPVATLVATNQDKYVIIACSKIFVRYIADDILSIPYSMRNKVRILLAASSIGSVPIQLRPMMISFDRGFITDLPGNRNDNNHRAAARFLELLRNPEFAAMSTSGQQQVINGFSCFSTTMPSSTATNGNGNVNVEEWLKERPHLLNVDPEQAYRFARRELGALGGRMHFKAIHRRLTNTTIEVDPSQVDVAMKGLEGMDFLKTTAKPASKEDETLKGIKVFVEAVRKLAPSAVFSANDICTWAPGYFKMVREELPEDFMQPMKLVYIMKNNADLLGIQPTADNKSYAIKSEGRPSESPLNA